MAEGLTESMRKFIKTPEGEAFAAYLKDKINNLDSVSDINAVTLDPVEVAVEVRAKTRARDILVDVLTDLLGAKADKPPPVDKSEYQVG